MEDMFGDDLGDVFGDEMSQAASKRGRRRRTGNPSPPADVIADARTPTPTAKTLPPRAASGAAPAEATIRQKSFTLKLQTQDSFKTRVGSVDEVLFAANAAREELRAFAETEAPPFGLVRAIRFGICVFNIRPAIKFMPVGAPFTRSLVRIGGLERVQLLLTIARFDADADGSLNKHELNAMRIEGEKCVNSAVNGCANFAIISALLFGATHMVTMGRPGPFQPYADSVDSFGTVVTTRAAWACYILNVCAQSLALGTIITSIYMRQLLCNSLPSVMSKLVFLSDTNVLSLLATGATWMLAALVWLVTVGGFLAVPTYGFVSMAMLPLVLLMIVPVIYPAMLKTALRLHAEARVTLQQGDQQAVAHNTPLAAAHESLPPRAARDDRDPHQHHVAIEISSAMMMDSGG